MWEVSEGQENRNGINGISVLLLQPGAWDACSVPSEGSRRAEGRNMSSPADCGAIWILAEVPACD